jgi:hypothetical protein
VRHFSGVQADCAVGTEIGGLEFDGIAGSESFYGTEQKKLDVISLAKWSKLWEFLLMM